MEELLGIKLTDLYEGNASALRVLAANGAPSNGAVAAIASMNGLSVAASAELRFCSALAFPSPCFPSSRASLCCRPAADSFELKKRALHVYAEKQRVPDFRCLPLPAAPPFTVWDCWNPWVSSGPNS